MSKFFTKISDIR